MGIIPDTTELCGVGSFHFVFQVKAEILELSNHPHGGRDVFSSGALGPGVQVTQP